MTHHRGASPAAGVSVAFVPPLTDTDIAHNLSGYQQQVTPFIDFARADLRFNGEWLNKVGRPELVNILAHVTVSMTLQRDDFRNRLAAGDGLSVAEFVYSVVMALDSVAISADVERGGVDRLLNLQMCRKVMEIREQTPRSSSPPRSSRAPMAPAPR